MIVKKYNSVSGDKRVLMRLHYDESGHLKKMNHYIRGKLTREWNYSSDAQGRIILQSSRQYNKCGKLIKERKGE